MTLKLLPSSFRSPRTLHRNENLASLSRLLDSRIRPAHPFDPGNGDWGAVELVARVAVTSLERGTLFRLVTDLTDQTNRMGSVTVGMNWWPIQNIRISVDGIREDYYGGIVFMPAGPERRTCTGSWHDSRWTSRM